VTGVAGVDEVIEQPVRFYCTCLLLTQSGHHQMGITAAPQSAMLG